MRYENVSTAIFLERPNRFIAYVKQGEEVLCCHVKNTGRCKELLRPGAVVYLSENDKPQRKTRYDLIGVEKGDVLFNIDAQAPNQLVLEWLKRGGLYKTPTFIRPEKTYGKSRMDFYVEDAKRKAFIEVKGVTLEQDGIAAFPDAPTERGLKHIFHLQRAREEGYEAYLIFILQFRKAKWFRPHDEMHEAFGTALRQAQQKGVRVLAYDCHVKADEILWGDEVLVKL